MNTITNFGADLGGFRAYGSTTWPTSATGLSSGTASTAFDRLSVQRTYRSAAAIVPINCTGGMIYNQSLRVGCLLESATATGAAYAAVPQVGATDGIVLYGPVGQGTATGTYSPDFVAVFPFDLSGARRYIRFTPQIETHVYNTTATATEVITMDSLSVVFMGADRRPAAAPTS